LAPGEIVSVAPVPDWLIVVFELKKYITFSIQQFFFKKIVNQKKRFTFVSRK
jgi:hypothetical protein